MEYELLFILKLECLKEITWLSFPLFFNIKILSKKIYQTLQYLHDMVMEPAWQTEVLFAFLEYIFSLSSAFMFLLLFLSLFTFPEFCLILLYQNLQSAFHFF